MNVQSNHIQRIILTIFAMATLFVAYADTEDKNPIVIVASYNPDAKSMSEKIEPFSNEYLAKGGKKPIQIETMNCLSLSEALEWKDRLWNLLSKYYQNGNKPSMVVLLGSEASTAFFSLTQKEIKGTPVVVGSRSNNIVKLPDNNVNIHEWEPKPFYLNKDFKDYNIVGGQIYTEDVDANVNLLHRIFPERDSVTFLSDNSIGGVTIRAHFIQEMKKHPHYKISFLDGRQLLLQEVITAITELKGNKAVFIGTWRIDNSEAITLSSTIEALAKSNRDIPAFSLTGTGLDSWSVGGYVPDFSDLHHNSKPEGSLLADDVIAYEQTGKASELHVLNNVYKFNYDKTNAFGIKKDLFPKEYEMVNEPMNAFQIYQTQILIAVGIFVFLITVITITLHYLILSKKMERKLIDRGHELEIARDKAEKANAMKSAFIANMSHEIRTPLNAVVGFSQLLTEPEIELSDEEKQEYGGYIKVNSDTLLNLVNDILQISKMDAKSMVFNIVDADMVELCKTGAESARANLAPGVEIITKLPEAPIPVQTDVLRLQQVFNNLLSNAKKFTDHGTITVAIEETITPDEILISVTDTGCGIPADKADYVFQRFKQIDSFKQGTGLGLSITRSIIENLGGRIWLDTEYTNGARFVFTHPTRQD